MTFVWSGADPTGFSDPSQDYELGTKMHANADITINGVRVWAPAGGTSVTGRKARVYNGAGTLLGIATLTDSLPSGWNLFSMDTTVGITAGSDFWVTYSVLQTYGAVTGITYPFSSGDGLVTALSAGLNTNPATFPNDFNNTVFYGIDIDYSAGITEGQVPVVGITVVATAALTAAATLTIEDDAPAGVTYVIEWGDGQTSAPTGLGPHAHVYAAAGTYAVMVIAIDGDGNRDSAAAPVTVLPLPGSLHPTSELVAVGWLKAIGLTSGAVATTLPAPSTTGVISWAATGFVQVAGVGGTTGTDYRLRMPAIGVTCYAASQGSSKPPWGKANQLAEQIVAAAEAGTNWRLTNLPAAYAHAHVQNVRCSEPRRLPDDGGGYARYTFDMYLDWIEV